MKMSYWSALFIFISSFDLLLIFIIQNIKTESGNNKHLTKSKQQCVGYYYTVREPNADSLSTMHR